MERVAVAKLVGRGRRARALVLQGSKARWCRVEVRGKLVIVRVSEQEQEINEVTPLKPPFIP